MASKKGKVKKEQEKVYYGPTVAENELVFGVRLTTLPSFVQTVLSRSLSKTLSLTILKICSLPKSLRAPYK
jgi:hypothetical protein